METIQTPFATKFFPVTRINIG